MAATYAHVVEEGGVVEAADGGKHVRGDAVHTVGMRGLDDVCVCLQGAVGQGPDAGRTVGAECPCGGRPVRHAPTVRLSHCDGIQGQGLPSNSERNQLIQMYYKLRNITLK